MKYLRKSESGIVVPIDDHNADMFYQISMDKGILFVHKIMTELNFECAIHNFKCDTTFTKYRDARIKGINEGDSWSCYKITENHLCFVIHNKKGILLNYMRRYDTQYLFEIASSELLNSNCRYLLAHKILSSMRLYWENRESDDGNRVFISHHKNYMNYKWVDPYMDR